MRFRCNMPVCGDWPLGFEFEGNAGVCPRCDQRAAPLVDVHFVYLTPRGPIAGFRGLRQAVACQPDRPHLATAVQFFSATDQPSCVTCPKCKATPAYAASAGASGLIDGRPVLPRPVTVDMGAKAPG